MFHILLIVLMLISRSNGYKSLNPSYFVCRLGVITEDVTFGSGNILFVKQIIDEVKYSL